MEPAFGTLAGKRERITRTVLALLVLLLVVGFNYPVDMPSGRGYDKGQNAIWLESRWSDTLVPREERWRLANSLAKQGIRWLYADEGTLRADGTIPRVNSLYAGGLTTDVHREQPQMRVLAWMKGYTIGSSGLRLADPLVRARIVESARYFTEQQGFDGVHLDIEPVPSNDAGYIELLDEMRAGIGRKAISVAAMKWTPLAPRLDGLSLLPYSWEGEYYQQVGQRANQIVLTSYDSAMPFANLYIKYVSWQTNEVLDALRDSPSCQVLIGIPTYHEQRAFYTSPENAGTGLQGVIESLRDQQQSGTLPDNFTGVALFGEWTTSGGEWQLYDNIWRK